MPAPNTIYAPIKQLEPDQYLNWSANALNLKYYSRLPEYVTLQGIHKALNKSLDFFNDVFANVCADQKIKWRRC